MYISCCSMQCQMANVGSLMPEILPCRNCLYFIRLNNLMLYIPRSMLEYHKVFIGIEPVIFESEINHAANET
ncbi:hypothetical protein D3C86_1185100 [compost metagenome]